MAGITEDGLDLTDVDDFFEHFGVKGMHWGVHKSSAELEAKASEHESKAKSYASTAKQLEADHADLTKNGLQSKAFKRVYGQDAHMQSDWSFYARNGQSQGEALRETSNNLRMAHNSYVRAANRHAKKAVKIRAKLADAAHSDLDTPDEFLEHFGRKGMKWGEHIFGGKDGSGRNKAAAKAASDKIASPDAKTASDLHARVNASGTKNLTNKELQDLVTRMNLEQQYSKLSTGGSAKKGQNFVQKYNGHTQTGITAIKTTKEVAKIVGPLLAAAAAGAAASRASGHSGPVKMPRLAIGS